MGTLNDNGSDNSRSNDDNDSHGSNVNGGNHSNRFKGQNRNRNGKGKGSSNNSDDNKSDKRFAGSTPGLEGHVCDGIEANQANKCLTTTTKIGECAGRSSVKCGSHVKKNIEKRAKHLMPCPIKPSPKRKIKQKDASCMEVDNDVELEIHKEQIELIARQECEHVAKSGQACNIVCGQCARMLQNKTKIHDQCEEGEKTDNPSV